MPGTITQRRPADSPPTRFRARYTGPIMRDAGSETVLVVDDEPDLLEVTRFALESEGFGVETARNGEEALALLLSGKRPGLVLLDLMMPVMNGWELIAVWQADLATQGIPIIAMSAAFSAPTAHALGIDAFVPKPFDIERLLMTVKALLREGQ
jgi:CheY-like chemotaxis protein